MKDGCLCERLYDGWISFDGQDRKEEKDLQMLALSLKETKNNKRIPLTFFLNIIGLKTNCEREEALLL